MGERGVSLELEDRAVTIVLPAVGRLVVPRNLCPRLDEVNDHVDTLVRLPLREEQQQAFVTFLLSLRTPGPATVPLPDITLTSDDDEITVDGHAVHYGSGGLVPARLVSYVGQDYFHREVLWDVGDAAALERAASVIGLIPRIRYCLQDDDVQDSTLELEIELFGVSMEYVTVRADVTQRWEDARLLPGDDLTGISEYWVRY